MKVMFESQLTGKWVCSLHGFSLAKSVFAPNNAYFSGSNTVLTQGEVRPHNFFVSGGEHVYSCIQVCISNLEAATDCFFIIFFFFNIGVIFQP